ncbi:hypothetical protein ACJIZ3_003965 [Penstemon smallii]|uniref:Tify domain-containing protein n=1 Tax=Penstemon smallii TaxID=265156 RepID=A0ABD3S0T1_9LAMI
MNNISKANVSGPMANGGGTRIEAKCGYWCLIDPTEQEQVLYKKQAISSSSTMNDSSCLGNFSYRSEVPTFNVSDNNAPYIAYSDTNKETTLGFGDQFRNSFYFGGNNNLFSTAFQRAPHDTLVAPDFNNFRAIRPKELNASVKKRTDKFPSNVRILLSTGILDGVPVKYVSWSRDSINAYDFECHAGSKSKHPNKHIYFENGKTIYGVVQELKCTPRDMLLEVIRNVTGSPINQKNFHAWKESYISSCNV